MTGSQRRSREDRAVSKPDRGLTSSIETILLSSLNRQMRRYSCLFSLPVLNLPFDAIWRERQAASERVNVTHHRDLLSFSTPTRALLTCRTMTFFPSTTLTG